MNVCVLTGNAVKDFEIRKTTNGKSVTSNTIAVRRDMKDGNGEYPTDFIDFVAWDHQADYLTKYAKKGDYLELAGRWQVRKYTTKNGENRVANELVIVSASCKSKREEPSQAPQREAPRMEQQRIDVPSYGYDPADDLPF